MNLLGIIPARFGSTRFPGKPLAEIKGKPMIQRTWEQAKKAIDDVVIATDDERIEKAVIKFGGKVFMTSSAHQSGTDRCAEVAEIISSGTEKVYDVIINIQGDEPFIHPQQISLLAGCFREEEVKIATLIKKITTPADIFNSNIPKVIFNKLGYALYFSRSPIPYVRGAEKKDWIRAYTYFRHLGMYAYRTGTLKEITQLEPAPLEMAESLEQNRWLENGYSIKLKETMMETISVDTPEDLDKVNRK
ncbi:MAG: 3-deoxy-manno-octulosonate cytidylyltransferase [Bacteroidales bacterium]